MSDAILNRSTTEKQTPTELDKKMAATLSEQSWRHTVHQSADHETLTTARGEGARIAAQQNAQRTQPRLAQDTSGVG
ncbi:hypothetical protein ABTE41_19605, partial [Acinetobacter baumannii]